jgi:hypothetical protein
MTNGIGNPDWQRRYTTSAAPILTAVYPDNTNSISPLSDSNGYEYLTLIVNMGTSTVFARAVVIWYQDDAGTIQMATTTFVVGPQSSNAIKIPVISRFYTVSIGNVGGATGQNILLAVYGTNADNDNLLTQNTDQPQARASATIAAGGTLSTPVIGTFGGEVMMTMEMSGTAMWTAFVEYYDWSTKTYITFWTVRGLDKGMAYAERIFLPYAPVRMNIRNDDSTSHVLVQAMVCP